MQRRIDVFHTHIEVSPYTKGEFFELEKALSRWNQITKKHGRYEAVAYFIREDVLFLPKGINIEALEDYFGCKATMNYKANPKQKMSEKYDVLIPPRSQVQIDSVEFLTATGKYASRIAYCQYTLNLETAGGKTYCAINSFTQLGVKTLIVVNREYLSSHWKSEIAKFTSIPDDRILQVDTEGIRRVLEAEIDADVYIVMHQTIQSYAKIYGWQDVNEFMKVAGIGLKVYDECHEFISSIFVIDANTNVEKTFYLTATYGRSNKQENKVFQLMLSASCKYNDENRDYVKKIHYHPVLYRSRIPLKYVMAMKSAHGFSSYKFIDGALKCDPEKKILHALRFVLSESLDREGQILIVTPKKESVTFIAEFLSEIVGNSRSIGTIFSDNTDEINFQNQNCNIISSTIKSCGTGFNPPNLQTIICMEPHSSRIMTHQLKGRLDRFKGDDTYFYDLIDMNIPFMETVKAAHTKELEKVAKEISDIEVLDHGISSIKGGW